MLTHCLDRFEAPLGGFEEVANLGLLHLVADAPRLLLHLGHLLLNVPDLRVLRAIFDRELLLFLAELAEVVPRRRRGKGLGAAGGIAVRLLADLVHGVGDGPEPDPLLREFAA